MAENQFLTSVADVQLFDLKTGDLILNGKTLLNSSLTQAIQSQAIYGGKTSQKLFELNYQKELTFAIEDAVFNVAYICLQNNAKVVRELSEYYATEEVLLDASGAGSVSQTPVGNVHIEMPDGTYKQLIPTGKGFTEPALKDQLVTVAYMYNEMMENIDIKADTFPAAVKMVLNADIMTNAGKEKEIQILVHKFKPDGALELSMTHDGVSSSALAGSAISHKGSYAKISLKEVNLTDVPLVALAATPAEVALDSAVLGDSSTITMYGIRGGSYGNILLDNTKLTWTSDDTNVATVVDGVITLGATATTGNTTVVRVTDGTFTDVIAVEII